MHQAKETICVFFCFLVVQRKLFLTQILFVQVNEIFLFLAVCPDGFNSCFFYTYSGKIKIFSSEK